jgi:putative hydrolase of the HAD superfamily
VDQTQPTAAGDADLDQPSGGATSAAGTAGGVVVDGAPAAQDAGTRTLTALIVDWGGVLTDPLDTAMTTWARADGVDFAHFADVMKAWIGASGSGPVASGGAGGPDGETVRADAGTDPRVLSELEDAARLGLVPSSPVHALERGEISIQEFEHRLAAALKERGSVVEPEGLLGRVLGGLAELRDDMLGLVRRARHSGLRTALLSNSWGDENYPEEEWEGAFDVVVISGRVGMRKPEAEIFLHTAHLLGVPPEQCVMVDDLAGNIRGAVDAGMVGVLHKTYEETAEELEILFDRTLR